MVCKKEFLVSLWLWQPHCSDHTEKNGLKILVAAELKWAFCLTSKAGIAFLVSSLMEGQLTLSHPEQPKLHRVLAVLSVIWLSFLV